MKGIYKIENKINNKVYIGESENIKERWRYHKEDLNNNNHHSYKLQTDWNTYGENNFEFKVLRNLDNLSGNSFLYVYEDNFIKEYNSVENGYNIRYTLDDIIKGINTNCNLYHILQAYNIMKLNNNEYPERLIEFIIHNPKYFNYELYKNNINTENFDMIHTIFGYYIKDEYKTLRCDNIEIETIRNSKILDYLKINNVKIKYYNDDFNTIEISTEDYEKHLFSYLDYLNNNI